MKLYVKNTLSGLVPLYASDLDQKRKLKLGETYEVDIRRPRNLGRHRMFFAMLNIGHQNTAMDLPFETYRRWAIMKAGFVRIYETPRGQMFEPESIAFSSMDEDMFQSVFDRVLDVIIEDIGVEKKEIMDLLIDFM